METRPWRFGIWFGNEMVPVEGEISWMDKRIILKNPEIPFADKGVYDAAFVDPTHAYTLVRAHLRPLEIERDPEDKTKILSVLFEFFHRKGWR